MGFAFEHGVVHAEVFALVPGGVQKSGVEVADFPVTILHIVWKVDVLTAFKAGVPAWDQNKWPLAAATVMRLGCIGQIHNDRVVQHLSLIHI